MSEQMEQKTDTRPHKQIKAFVWADRGMNHCPTTEELANSEMYVRWADFDIETKLLIEDRDNLERQRNALIETIEAIRDMPCSMVNDSESLRHTIKSIRHSCELALALIESKGD